MPSTDVVDFLRGPVMLSHLNSWTIATVGPHNFGVKWYAGRARPEEVAFAIQEGDIPASAVPEDVTMALDTLRSRMGVERFEAVSYTHLTLPTIYSV